MSFSNMIQRLRVECVIAVFNSFSKVSDCRTFGRFVSERIPHQYLTEGEGFNRSNSGISKHSVCSLFEL